MKKTILAMLLSSPWLAYACGDHVVVSVTEKTNGAVTASPRFLANVGETASVKLADGVAVEAETQAPEADGRSWTKVRFTYLKTADASMVQEMNMRHKVGEGSFEFTDPGTQKHYTVSVGPEK
ncbi:MAG TPA: hypothetical protein VLT89_12410 [Usitatibacter sp.]|nr:hypothetical protein [Usitatibacter sp.]